MANKKIFSCFCRYENIFLSLFLLWFVVIYAKGFYILIIIYMKKIITWTLVGLTLLSSGVFAAEMPVNTAEPTFNTSDSIETTSEASVNDLIKKYELILRNNILESDYEYNLVNYFTSKMFSKDIIVPKEIKDTASKIYFLVEEWSDRIFYAEDSMGKWGGIDIDEVKKEYNYKIIDFIENKEEYIFNNVDLVKDFWEDKYKNVTITLMAEFSDTERAPLSNTAYININDKKSVLEQLKNKENEDETYFGYFNSDDIEDYLENLASKITRVQYKSILEKAEKKIKETNKMNEDNMQKILDSIVVESDFANNVSKYKIYSETQNLFMSLWNAVKNQIQNIRAFDAIDSILK